MQGVVFPVGCGDDDESWVKAAENSAFHPREPSGVDVLDGFQENGRVDGAIGPVAVLERAETHVHAPVAAEEVEAEPLAGMNQRLGIDVHAQQSGKLSMVAKLQQQFSAATPEISHMPGARSKQGLDDGIQAGAMQGRRH